MVRSTFSGSKPHSRPKNSPSGTWPICGQRRPRSSTRFAPAQERGSDVDRCKTAPQWSAITDASRPALRAEQTVTIVPAGALNSNPRPAMTQTSNRFFDEMARLMNDAAGVASGVRREFDTMFRNQADRILRDLDVVKREEFEAVKDMARLAREENETLKARIAALEAKLGAGGNP